MESLGADSDFSQLLFMGGLAHSWERNTFFGGFEFDYTADGVAPVQNRRAGQRQHLPVSRPVVLIE